MEQKFTCNQCCRTIVAGIQCAIKTMDERLYFVDMYCSLDCLHKYISIPHIFGLPYVEHFTNEKLEEGPQPHMEINYFDFIEKYKDTFLGKVIIPERIELQNKMLDSISYSLLGRNKKRMKINYV